MRLAPKSISHLSQFNFGKLAHVFASFLNHDRSSIDSKRKLTLILRIAATISRRLVGRATSSVPMYCKKKKTIIIRRIINGKDANIP